MRNLLAIFLMLCGLFVSAAKAEDCVDVNLVLAVDSSWSINAIEWRIQMLGYQSAFFDEEVVELIAENPCGAIAVTVVRWAGLVHQKKEIDWTLVHDATSAAAFGKQLGELPFEPQPGTGIYLAIEFSLGLLSTAPYQAMKSVIDISGDGVNSPGTKYIFNEPCKTAEALFVTVNGLPIVEPQSAAKQEQEAAVIKDDLLLFTGSLDTPVDWFYEHNVICGPGAFIVVAHGFEDFAEAIKRKLMAELMY